MPAVALAAPDGSRATVLLHGGHLVSWVTPDGRERLFLSSRAVFDGRAAVRGGVPVIFPQFNARGPLPRHGFARGRPWSLVDARVDGTDALAVLRLADDAATQAVWPARFVVELTVRIGGPRLDIELAVEHPEAPAQDGTPPAPWRFTAALHTYLRVADVAALQVLGLQRLRMEDAVRGTEQVDLAAQLVPAGETDRVYFDAARPLLLDDAQARLRLSQQGFRDVVVWNPGEAKGEALPDMGPGEWRHMLCIEAAQIGQPVALAPGESWIGRQVIELDEAAPG
ncbi:D-hexose-6-phosphate mutarotase [Piscinibacter sakaiensis]|uniref:D-hexose-6-phosphate mutarotase n=1 Tax=Piscinibacter sakaiensis TaxID=1547922 RepID=UPI0006B659D1